MAAPETILNKIQTSYRDIFKHGEVLETTQRELQSNLETIENLSEQFQCCQKLIFNNTPLASFPDLQANLKYKISVEIEKNTESLKTYVKQLGDFSLNIERQFKLIMELYKNTDISILEMTQAEPTRPSIATLLEWLDSLNQQVFCLYVTKAEMLKKFDYQSEESVEQLVKKWRHDDNLHEKITEIKPYLQYFMAEQFGRT